MAVKDCWFCEGSGAALGGRCILCHGTGEDVDSKGEKEEAPSEPPPEWEREL